MKKIKKNSHPHTRTQQKGAVLPIIRTEYPIQILQPDGSLSTQTVVVERSIHGPIYSRAPGAALASRWGGQDRPDSVEKII